MNTELMPKCSQCGAALPANAPAGLCPSCLMALNLKTETVLTDDSPAAQPPLPPEQLAPHFPQLEILEYLGRGGMGVVYKARQKTLNRLVALKLLAPERVPDVKFAERFAREAQALAALNHPNIVTIHDFGQAGGFFYLLMEFVDGANLRQLLRTQKFTPEEALAIVPPLCDALQYAHDRGIVHRDIKPENLLLDKAGRVKVADFGIAKMIEPETGRADLPVSPEVGAAQQHGSTGIVGTPSYSAPEQQSDPQRVDSRADIYSLGVVFYEMLTGELPGKRIEAPSKKVQIDVRLDAVVLRALEKKPELRYQQVSEVKTMVETIVATPPGSSRREEAQTENVEIGKQKAEMEPRFSRMAIVGTCWMPFALIALVAVFVGFKHAAVPAGSSPSGPGLLGILVGLPLALLGITAPFGTTILGWVAASQIRRSAGKLYGLWLAVFDGLLFPLLALDALIFALGWLVAGQIVPGAFGDAPDAGGKTAIFFAVWISGATLVAGVSDWLIIRRVWRAVNRPAVTPAPPVQKPDHFWRKFAVVVLALISIPIVISIVGLLAAIAIPNFVKARQVSQQNAAKQWTQQGWQLWQAGKFSEAEAKFQQSVQLSPDKADAWNGLGWAQFNAGNSAGAETSFRRAIAIETNQPGALNGLGQFYLSQRKYDDAEKYLLQAAPQAPAAWYGLARLYLLEGKFAEAEKYAQRIVDSGQADDTARKMLDAAKAKKLSEGLRMIIGQLPAKKSSQAAPVEITAQKITFNSGSQTLTASGDVVIKYGRTNDSAVFGPVVERVIEQCEAPDYKWFDLDKGISISSASLPQNVEDAIFEDWMRKTGADIGANGGNSPDLIARGGDFIAVPVQATLWNSGSVEEFERLISVTRPEKKIALMLSHGELPATFVFQTREGGKGVLQILGSSVNPRGVKVRYKQVQDGKPKQATTAEAELNTNQDIAHLKLQSAELVVKDAERKFAVGVITEYDLQKVKFTRDLAAAEASGNPVEAARITLAVAELDLNVVGNQVAVGKATSLEYEQAKLTRDIAKIRYKLVQDGVSNPVTTAGAALNTNQDIARLKLQSAELVVKDAEVKFAVRAITEYDLKKVKYARDLAAAEASGNPVEAARINLAAAELDLDVVGKKVAVGTATSLEYEQAKLARDAAKVRYQQVQSTTNSDVGNGSHASANRSDQIAVEDLALQMIVAIRGKDDVKLKSLATERIKGWTDALPVFAVELRERYRQSTGNEAFDLRGSESLVEGELGIIRCTGPAKLEGKCLILFFVKTAEGWRNHSLRAATVSAPLARFMADFKQEIEKENAAASKAESH